MRPYKSFLCVLALTVLSVYAAPSAPSGKTDIKTVNKYHNRDINAEKSVENNDWGTIHRASDSDWENKGIAKWQQISGPKGQLTKSSDKGATRYANAHEEHGKSADGSEKHDSSYKSKGNNEYASENKEWRSKDGRVVKNEGSQENSGVYSDESKTKSISTNNPPRIPPKGNVHKTTESKHYNKNSNSQKVIEKNDWGTTVSSSKWDSENKGKSNSDYVSGPKGTWQHNENEGASKHSSENKQHRRSADGSERSDWSSNNKGNYAYKGSNDRYESGDGRIVKNEGTYKSTGQYTDNSKHSGVTINKSHHKHEFVPSDWEVESITTNEHGVQVVKLIRSPKKGGPGPVLTPVGPGPVISPREPRPPVQTLPVEPVQTVEAGASAGVVSWTSSQDSEKGHVGHRGESVQVVSADTYARAQVVGENAAAKAESTATGKIVDKRSGRETEVTSNSTAKAQAHGGPGPVLPPVGPGPVISPREPRPPVQTLPVEPVQTVEAGASAPSGKTDIKTVNKYHNRDINAEKSVENNDWGTIHRASDSDWENKGIAKWQQISGPKGQLTKSSDKGATRYANAHEEHGKSADGSEKHDSSYKSKGNNEYASENKEWRSKDGRVVKNEGSQENSGVYSDESKTKSISTNNPPRIPPKGNVHKTTESKHYNKNSNSQKVIEKNDWGTTVSSSKWDSENKGKSNSDYVSGPKGTWQHNENEGASKHSSENKQHRRSADGSERSDWSSNNKGNYAYKGSNDRYESGDGRIVKNEGTYKSTGQYTDNSKHSGVTINKSHHKPGAVSWTSSQDSGKGHVVSADTNARAQVVGENAAAKAESTATAEIIDKLSGLETEVTSHSTVQAHGGPGPVSPHLGPGPVILPGEPRPPVKTLPVEPVQTAEAEASAGAVSWTSSQDSGKGHVVSADTNARAQVVGENAAAKAESTATAEIIDKLSGLETEVTSHSTVQAHGGPGPVSPHLGPGPVILPGEPRPPVKTLPVEPVQTAEAEASAGAVSWTSSQDSGKGHVVSADTNARAQVVGENAAAKAESTATAEIIDKLSGLETEVTSHSTVQAHGGPGPVSPHLGPGPVILPGEPRPPVKTLPVEPVQTAEAEASAGAVSWTSSQDSGKGHVVSADTNARAQVVGENAAAKAESTATAEIIDKLSGLETEVTSHSTVQAHGGPGPVSPHLGPGPVILPGEPRPPVKTLPVEPVQTAEAEASAGAVSWTSSQDSGKGHVVSADTNARAQVVGENAAAKAESTATAETIDKLSGLETEVTSKSEANAKVVVATGTATGGQILAAGSEAGAYVKGSNIRRRHPKRRSVIDESEIGDDDDIEDDIEEESPEDILPGDISEDDDDDVSDGRIVVANRPWGKRHRCWRTIHNKRSHHCRHRRCRKPWCWCLY